MSFVVPRGAPAARVDTGPLLLGRESLLSKSSAAPAPSAPDTGGAPSQSLEKWLFFRGRRLSEQFYSIIRSTFPFLEHRYEKPSLLQVRAGSGVGRCQQTYPPVRDPPRQRPQSLLPPGRRGGVGDGDAGDAGGGGLEPGPQRRDVRALQLSRQLEQN